MRISDWSSDVCSSDLRLSMRKIREVLRLKFDAGLSVRKIAKSLSIGHSSAGDYLCRFAASGLQWPIDLSDAELNRRLFPLAVPAPSDQRPPARKSGVSGKNGSVRVDLGG